MGNFMLRQMSAACLVLVLLAAPLGASAQAVTAVITGSVIDATGGILPIASVRLTNLDTNDPRDPLRVDEYGTFVVQGVFPCRYSLRVEADGFKPMERREINASPGSRVAVGQLRLEVGNVTESMTVSEQAALVQTVSVE